MKTNNDSVFGAHLHKFIEFASWCRWFPDLFLDLCRPKEGSISLKLDQRVFIRSLLRFFEVYGCLPRGSGKTFCEVIGLFLVAIFYPNITLSVTAQTKENAVKLLHDKFDEIMRFWPILSNELERKPKFTVNEGIIYFKNGSRIDALANSQTSKGQRRHRINIEEAALVDNFTFEDAVEPIVEVPRTTCGKLSLIDPYELNHQINFFTTPGWRGSDQWRKCVSIGKKMIDLQGGMVIGSDWMPACWYGRGSSKTKILERKSRQSPTTFNQNYGGIWTGSSDNALVNINKLLACRTLSAPIMQAEKETDEWYMGIDVARSQRASNNKSSIVLGRVSRNPETNKIRTIQVGNLYTISNELNFSQQAAIIKKVAAKYNPKMAICDGNGLGSGLIDKLLEKSRDLSTGEILPCWDTVNTDNIPEDRNALKCLYDIKATGIQTRIITTFINAVDSDILQLLVRKENCELMVDSQYDFANKVMPYVQTELLFEEIANLKIKYNSSGAMSLEKVVRKIDKDRFSALAYMIYYIMEYCGNLNKTRMVSENTNLLSFKAPSYSQRGWNRFGR